MKNEHKAGSKQALQEMFRSVGRAKAAVASLQATLKVRGK